MSAWARLKAEKEDRQPTLPGEQISQTHRQASFDDVVFSGYQHREEVPLDQPQFDESFEMIAEGRGAELTGEPAFVTTSSDRAQGLQRHAGGDVGSDDLGQVDDDPVEGELGARWLLTAEVLCLIVGVIALVGLIFGLIALSGR